MNTATATRPTEKQIAFVGRLLAEIDEYQADNDNWPEARLAYAETVADGTRRTASTMIDQLIALRDNSRRAARTVAPAATPVPEGIHFTAGTVYKVQRSQHGRLYAKRLDADAQTFEYIGSEPLRHLSESTLMTLADAEEFGQLYGICARCGLLLTDEKSIARGVGPVCAKRF